MELSQRRHNSDYLESTFKISEIYKQQYADFDTEWLTAKFFHTLNVVKTGKEIMYRNSELNSLPPQVQDDMIKALLFHDFARSHEKRADGQMPFRYHGAASTVMVAEHENISSPLILIPILVHDQMDRGFIDLPDEELKKSPNFQACSGKEQFMILQLRSAYNKLSAPDKRQVDLAVGLVKDADTLANMRDFEILFPLTKEAKDENISFAVQQNIDNKGYVDYSGIKTLPDRAMAYYAYAFKFTFAETMQAALDENLFTRIKDHVLKEVRQAKQGNVSESDLQKTGAAFDKVIRYFEDESNKANKGKASEKVTLPPSPALTNYISKWQNKFNK